MKISPAGLVCLALCTPLLAQTTKVVSSPPGYETMGQIWNQPGYPAEYRSWGYDFGMYANQRFQAADGLFRKNPMLISEISYRLDQQDYPADKTPGGVGRTWTNVTLTMSECDYDKVTSTFSTNSLTSRSVVFNSAMTWTSQVGLPSGNPAPWGEKGFKFPFNTNWLYSGANDMLLDYVFLGGTLANNAAWASTTQVKYYLDGFYCATVYNGEKIDYPDDPIKTNPPYCQDSGQNHGTNEAAYNNLLGISVYSGESSQPRGSISLGWRTFDTAINALCIQALGLAGLPAGIDINAGCNKLYLDPTAPWILFFNKNTGTYTTSTTSFSGTWTQAILGASVWFQSAWNDSVTTRFSLTTATQAKIPPVPPLSIRKQGLYSPDPTSATATSGPTNSSGTGYARNPMYLITYQ